MFMGAVRCLVACCVFSICIFDSTQWCRANLIISDAIFAHDFETISGNSITALQGPNATSTSDAIGNSTSPLGFGSLQHMRAIGGATYPAVDTNTILGTSTSGLSFSIFYNDRGDNGGDDSGGNVARLLSSYTGPGSPPNQLDFSVIDARRLVLFVEGENIYSTANIPFQDGLWHHAGFVFDNGLLSFYFDGELLGDQLSVGSNTVADQTNNWFLMNTVAMFGDEYFDDGDYDEAALWNRALSGAEMRALYTQGLAMAIPEPSAFSCAMIALASYQVCRRRKPTA